MAKQVINVGTANFAGDGDALRTAFTKVNDNFTELYDDDLQDITLNSFSNSVPKILILQPITKII